MANLRWSKIVCLYERLSVVKITLIQIVIKLIDGMSSKLTRGPGVWVGIMSIQQKIWSTEIS